jgi:hypothetical protein
MSNLGTMQCKVHCFLMNGSFLVITGNHLAGIGRSLRCHVTVSGLRLTGGKTCGRAARPHEKELFKTILAKCGLRIIPDECLLPASEAGFVCLKE